MERKHGDAARDAAVIEAFLDGGATAAFGPTLHVEGSTMKLDGWWPLAFRISGRTVIVRHEAAPRDTTALADLTAALADRGLSEVGIDLPAIGALTYTNVDLGYAPWALWSTDLANGEADINAKATEETFLEPGAGGHVPPSGYDTTAHVRGARRLAGDAAALVLTVGVPGDLAAALEEGLADCRFDHRAFGEIAPGACAALLPTVIVVDATRPAGPAFIPALHDGSVAGIPIVALTTGGNMQPGADATVDAADPPATTVALITVLVP